MLTGGALGAGDKEASFVGSKQWIGALELSYVLDSLLGVTCRILDVQSGAELPSKARELAHHFDTQGAPSPSPPHPPHNPAPSSTAAPLSQRGLCNSCQSYVACTVRRSLALASKPQV